MYRYVWELENEGGMCGGGALIKHIVVVVVCIGKEPKLGKVSGYGHVPGWVRRFYVGSSGARVDCCCFA